MICNPMGNSVGVRAYCRLAFSLAMLLPAWAGVAAQASAASAATPAKAACELLTAKEASGAIGLPVERVPPPSMVGRNMCWFGAVPSVEDLARPGAVMAKSVAILITPCVGSMEASCAALIPDLTESLENHSGALWKLNHPGATVEKVDGLGESARFITEADNRQKFMILNVRMQQSVFHLQLMMSMGGEFLPGRKAAMIEAIKLILSRAAQAPASSQAAPLSPRRGDTLTNEQAASGQPQRPAETALAQANTPVGHWVAEHPSKGGIGSWWEFRPDGRLTMHAGVVVTFPITRSGNTMTRPGDTVNGPPRHFTFQVVGETLHLIQNVYEMAGVSDMAAFRQKAPDYKGPETIDMAYSRVGAAPSAADPLLGQWKPVPTRSE